MATPTTPSDENADSEPSMVEDILDEDLGKIGGGWRGY